MVFIEFIEFKLKTQSKNRSQTLKLFFLSALSSPGLSGLGKGGQNVARVTGEDCLVRVPNRYSLVHIVARWVRQMREGAQYLVHSPKNEDVVVALREIAAGKILVEEESEDQDET